VDCVLFSVPENADKHQEYSAKMSLVRTRPFAIYGAKIGANTATRTTDHGSMGVAAAHREPARDASNVSLPKRRKRDATASL
jgi:hypothetical protein